jgi:predicted nucleic acid-binding protein
MPKPRIYVETSVISYLTARPSNDIINLSRQRASQMLWQAQDRFELVISAVVLNECRMGNARAAALRLACAQPLPVLATTDEALQLAMTLLRKRALPKDALADATHIAIAAVFEVQAIASWNFRHIASAWARSRIESALRDLGYNSPIIATPEELIEHSAN